MSAITPFLEEQDDPAEDPTQDEWFGSDFSLAGGLAGLEYDEPGTPGMQPEGPSPTRLNKSGKALEDRVLQVSHAKLLSTSWTRYALQMALSDNTLTLRQGYEKGEHYAYLELAEAPGRNPRFNAPGDGTNRTARLLTWTSKMGTPSFSLPAGPPQYGGSCPGALGGQSIVPTQALVRQQHNVERTLGEPVVLADAVCEYCYAEGGNYRYGTKQMQQVMLMSWTGQALRDGSFVPVMDWSIKNADFKLDGYKLPKAKGAEQAVFVPPERHPGKFFRIHDSGDFFSKAYVHAWAELARLNPDVMFWAPTRIYAANPHPERPHPWLADLDVPSNLIIRPSAYMVNRPRGPALPGGYASWSVVWDDRVKERAGLNAQAPALPPGSPYDWDCQAYAVEDEAHNCRFAVAPDGAEGCRACWVHPELTVNYTLH